MSEVVLGVYDFHRPVKSTWNAGPNVSVPLLVDEAMTGREWLLSNNKKLQRINVLHAVCVGPFAQHIGQKRRRRRREGRMTEMKRRNERLGQRGNVRKRDRREDKEWVKVTTSALEGAFAYKRLRVTLSLPVIKWISLFFVIPSCHAALSSPFPHPFPVCSFSSSLGF